MNDIELLNQLSRHDVIASLVQDEDPLHRETFYQLVIEEIQQDGSIGEVIEVFDVPIDTALAVLHECYQPEPELHPERYMLKVSG
ncbi:hypothetical protein [Dongshaea marina]|uniref:hypothetical protein n=1 Tax=Dongshaea marina TaxID=2047966 RepID=UPI000D3EBE48|nr:hypothetical protein [Dongshaea marina]